MGGEGAYGAECKIPQRICCLRIKAICIRYAKPFVLCVQTDMYYACRINVMRIERLAGGREWGGEKVGGGWGSYPTQPCRYRHLLHPLRLQWICYCIRCVCNGCYCIRCVCNGCNSRKYVSEIVCFSTFPNPLRLQWMLLHPLRLQWMQQHIHCTCNV